MIMNENVLTKNITQNLENKDKDKDKDNNNLSSDDNVTIGLKSKSTKKPHKSVKEKKDEDKRWHKDIGNERMTHNPIPMPLPWTERAVFGDRQTG